MTLLSDRWGGMRNLPHIPFASLPTPVQPLPSLSARTGAEIWCKRDDLSGDRYGGNKVRKLELLLGEALAAGHESLLTAGAAGSHHVLASAIYGRQAGLEVHAVLAPRPYSAHAEQNLRAALAAGAILHPARFGVALPGLVSAHAVRLRIRRKRPFVVPLGGTTAGGMAGYVEAGLELARQMESGQLPEPEAIFVPYGTGGTAAGLAVGLAASGVMAKVIAVRVVDAVATTKLRLHGLVEESVQLLRGLDDRFPLVAEVAKDNLRVDGEELGKGYGHPTPATGNAIRLLEKEEGLQADTTYTGKSLASLLRHAQGPMRGKRLLFLHTLSSRPLSNLVAAAPRLPKSLERLLGR